MAALGFPDGHFDAVVCVFGLFFVPDMEAQVAELWRMVRPGGQLAITTWGPGIFAPAYFIVPANLRKQWHRELQNKFAMDALILPALQQVCVGSNTALHNST